MTTSSVPVLGTYPFFGISQHEYINLQNKEIIYFFVFWSQIQYLIQYKGPSYTFLYFVYGKFSSAPGFFYLLAHMQSVIKTFFCHSVCLILYTAIYISRNEKEKHNNKERIQFSPMLKPRTSFEYSAYYKIAQTCTKVVFNTTRKYFLY